MHTHTYTYVYNNIKYITQRRHRSAFIDSSRPLYPQYTCLARLQRLLCMSYAKIVARGTAPTLILRARTMPSEDFRPFHGRKHLLIFYFILIYYIILCFFVIYFHKKKSRFLFIFLYYSCSVSPKNSRRGGQVLLAI